MVISYVLRLRTDLASDGTLRGEVEAVGSGRRAGFGSVSHLTDFLMKSLPEEIAKAELVDQRHATGSSWTAATLMRPIGVEEVQPTLQGQ